MNNIQENFSPTGKQLYAKGQEIFDVVKHIAELIPEEDEYLQTVKEAMIADAMVLQVKVTGAETVDLYDLKMEAACLIRKAANDLMVKKHSLKMFDFSDFEYFDIVRDLIEEYRLIFIRWVEEFNKWDYVIDRWGLFNPPGVGPHDKDPDDDFPFDNPFDEE